MLAQAMKMSNNGHKNRGLSPYQLGQLDAREDYPCVPELFVTRWQRKQYAAGYASIRATETTAAILGLSFVPATSPVAEVA